MPRAHKAPTPEQEEINAADAARVSIEAKLRAATVRNKKLERQRDDALAQLETVRQSKRAPIPVTTRSRKRLKSDLVRVVFGDTHGLHADPAAFGAMLGDLKRWSPHEVIMGGDLVNCGGFLAQKHAFGFVADTEDSYEEDIACANGHLDAIAAAAPAARIEYLEGNHEDRVERWAVTEALGHRQDADFLRRLVSPSTLLSLKKRGIPYYRRTERHDDLPVPGWIKRGKVFFTHEISSAKNAASSAIRETGGNLVFFHTHRADFSPLVLPGVGLIGAWCPGCLCRRQPLWRHTKPTHWVHGYAVQLVAPSGAFLHVNVLIENGESLVGSLLG